MGEFKGGPGNGSQEIRTIFVFETKDAIDHFVNNCWEFWRSGHQDREAITVLKLTRGQLAGDLRYMSPLITSNR